MSPVAANENEPMKSSLQRARRNKQPDQAQSPTHRVDTMDAINASIAQRPGMAEDVQVGGPAPAGDNAAKPEADPFDLDSLRLSQDFASAVGVKQLITTVPVRKPSKEWFVRTYPDST